MWIRLRLDIGWRDLMAGFWHGCFSRNETTARKCADECWLDPNRNTVVGLSVRTGLDLLLQALKYPAGSQVLFSAITIRDMTKIAQAHGLEAAGVDFDPQTQAISMSSLEKRVTPKTKALVVAHLFGAIPNMDEVIGFAQARGIFVIEDCAQAWQGRDYCGHPQADATLFSFGAIKTATALGGAIFQIRDPGLAKTIRDIESSYPTQRSSELRSKALKFSVLKIISSKLGFSWLVSRGRRQGKTVDEVLGGLTKGFPDEDLLAQIRQRPSAAMLKLLVRRMTKYNYAALQQRIVNGRRLVELLGVTKEDATTRQPELADEHHSFWLFPYRTDRPRQLLEHLRSKGFDATQFGRLELIDENPAVNCPVAKEAFEKTVFLPAYSSMPRSALEELATIINAWNDEPHRKEIGVTSTTR